MRILILYWHPEFMGPMRLAVWQHLHALDASSTQLELVYHNDTIAAQFYTSTGPAPEEINVLQQTQFDAVILHNTFLGMRWQPWFYRWKLKYQWLRELNCLKVAIPQDEYDHAGILDEWLFDWNVEVICTNFGPAQRKLLYPIMHHKATFAHCFTGYIDETVAKQYECKLQPLAARPHDLVYRASHLPYWFGHQGQLKHEIAAVVAERAKTFGLNYNISTRAEDTIVGEGWLDFLASGRCVIGCESGSSALDQRGQIQAQVVALQRQNPNISFAEGAACLPSGWDDYQFFAISPRHFEAVITKTCQILVEGHYDGVLEANKHYIPLKRDFSNLDEILQKIQDYQYLQDIVERAYQDIYLSGHYTYRRLASEIEQILTDQAQSRQHTMPPTQPLANNEPTLEILERQLVAERHHVAALQAQLQDLKERYGHLNSLQGEYAQQRRWFRLIAMVVIAALGTTAVVTALVTILAFIYWRVR